MKTTFTKLEKAIERINEEADGIFDLRIKYVNDEVRICDYNEEFYYGGYKFEQVKDKLEEALKKDTKDANAYLDCITCGLWICDFSTKK